MSEFNFTAATAYLIFTWTTLLPSWHSLYYTIIPGNRHKSSRKCCIFSVLSKSSSCCMKQWSIYWFEGLNYNKKSQKCESECFPGVQEALMLSHLYCMQCFTFFNLEENNLLWFELPSAGHQHFLQWILITWGTNCVDMRMRLEVKVTRCSQGIADNPVMVLTIMQTFLQ